MTNVVKFSIVALIAMASVVSYSCNKDTQATKEAIQDNVIQSRTLTGLCEDDIGGCPNVPYTTKIYTIHEGTPAYPDCEFTIELKVRWCPPNKLDVVYVGIGFNHLDPNCNQFDIDTDNPLIATAVIEQAEMDLIKAGTIRAVLEYSTIPPNYSLPFCGVNPTMTVNLFQSACRKTCLIKSKEEGYKVVVLPCGSSCCKSVNEVCIDPLTGKIKITEISSATPASPCTISGELPCPLGTVHTTPCTPTCISIDQGG